MSTLWYQAKVTFVVYDTKFDEVTISNGLNYKIPDNFEKYSTFLKIPNVRSMDR